MSTADRIELTCPHCAKNCTLSRDDYRRSVGQLIACPSCQGQMQLADFPGLHAPAPPAAVPSFSIATNQPAAPATESKKTAEPRKSPRWTKMAMLIATAVWIVWMPTVYTYYQMTATAGHKKVRGKDEYVNNATGKPISGAALRIASSFAAAFVGITLPTTLYFLSVFVLGVLHFALTR